jgi:hypothetical protein
MRFPRERPDRPELIYEDEAILVVYKPPRMHSSPGQGAGDLCAWIFERHPEVKLDGDGAAGDLAESGGDRSGLLRAGRSRSEGGLLHRLDFETSGLVLFARSAEAYSCLLDQQSRGEFRKEYLALASPSRECRPSGSRPERGYPDYADPRVWDEARDALDAPALSELLAAAAAGAGGQSLVRCAFRPYGPKGARVACLAPRDAERDAPTAARPEAPIYRSRILAASPRPAEGGGPGIMELRVGLERGFRHQIRAQLAWIGLPIVGDPLYGDVPDSRLRLYAVRLSLIHPISGNAFSVELDR